MRLPKLSHWHIPEAHFLESWGDARAHDGTASDHSAADCSAVWRKNLFRSADDIHEELDGFRLMRL